MEELLLNNDPTMKKHFAFDPQLGNTHEVDVSAVSSHGLGPDGDQAADLKPALTKAELADFLFDRLGLNKREAKDFVDAFFDEVRQTLEVGVSVKISGFGHFMLRDKPERPGRNPKTGEEIPIAARRVVTFHPSQKLKALVESTELTALDSGSATALAPEPK